MTTASDLSDATSVPTGRWESARDRRGSWIPTGGMMASRFMELRKRRGLMIALIFVNIGIPTIFLVIRLLSHALAPKSFSPAGGYDIFTNLVADIMYIFGFIVAAALGATAGSSDLTDGMFRHLVVTGRSRLALYLARIPAGLAIVVPLVAVGFTIVCAVCVFAAPAKLNYDGVNVPVGLSHSGFERWAAEHPDEVICDFPYGGSINANVPCGGPNHGPGGSVIRVAPGSAVSAPAPSSPAQARSVAITIAKQDYGDYRSVFLYPSTSLMIKTGLWLELEATIGLIVGLGLASLMGQRTVPVILMFVLELVLTPALSRTVISHLINGQRGLVGLAMAHLEPGGLPLPLSGGGPANLRQLVPESTIVAACVVVAWLVVWTALGAWRMMTRDA